MTRKNPRIPDAGGVGRSAIVPLVEGEEAWERHDRRLQTNLRARDLLEERCREARVVLEIKNEGQHWIFRYGGNRGEWWPSSAKLVFDQQWKQGRHVHDYEQLWVQLTRRWKIVQAAPQ